MWQEKFQTIVCKSDIVPVSLRRNRFLGCHTTLPSKAKCCVTSQKTAAKETSFLCVLRDRILHLRIDTTHINNLLKISSYLVKSAISFWSRIWSSFSSNLVRKILLCTLVILCTLIPEIPAPCHVQSKLIVKYFFRYGINRPFPSSLVPLFQSESKCKTILMKMTLICMQMKLHAELIFIWKVSHLDSFWNRGTRELGNGLL